jgi:glycerate kinase
VPRPRVLVAPTAFKGSCSAIEAAEAIAKGVRAAGGAPLLMPISDGGDGLIDSLLFGLNGKLYSANVTGPLGERRKAAYARIGSAAVIEMARASGLALVPKGKLSPMTATSRGTGELMLAALDGGAKELWIGLGGSATNDGGAGMAQALGARLLDREGRVLGPGPAELLRLDRIEMFGFNERAAKAKIVLISDVTNPLLGKLGSARVYGPQKGATPAQVLKIEQALSIWAKTINRDLGLDVTKMPGAGAAGGVAAGLLAFTDAELKPGSDFVLDALGAAKMVRSAEMVLTGEGRFDRQSFYGKAPAELAKLASKAGVNCGLICGQLEKGLGRELTALGIGRVVELSARRKPEDAMRQAKRLLERAGKLMTAFDD